MKQLYFLLLFVFNFSSVFGLNKPLAPSATITGGTAVCQNATGVVVTFTGSGGTAPYTFTYTINGGANIVTAPSTGNSINVVVPTNGLGTFIYNLVGVKDNTNTTQTLNSSTTFIVNTAPTIDFTFNNDNSCSGTSIQFTSSVSGPGTSTYSWDFGDSTTISTQANPTHSFTSLGCGTATFIVTLTVTKGGCTVVKTHIVTVKQKPDISFSDANATGVANQFSNCLNASLASQIYSITVDNNSNSLTCIASYSINWGDGNIENSVSFPISHTYNQLGAYNMVITAVGNNGCINSKTYVIKNVSNPAGGLTGPGGTQNLCAPTVDLQFKIAGFWGTNSLDTTYTINYGDNSPILTLTQSQLVSSIYYNSVSPNLSLEYPIPHSYTTTNCPNNEYTISLNITNACGTTPSTLGNIKILTKPVADFTTPINGCLNTNVTFPNTTIPGSDSGCVGTTKYIWNFGDPASGSSNIVNTGFVDIIPNGNHVFSSTGTFTVTLTAQNFCGTTTKTQQICIEPPLIPLFTLDNNSGCTPLTVASDNTTILTNSCPGNPTYEWNVIYNSGFCGNAPAVWNYTSGTSAISAEPVFNFVTPGTYTISLTTKNSCGYVTSPTQVVTVKKPPTVTINSIGPQCQNVPFTPLVNIDGCPNSSITGVLWTIVGGTPSSATTQTAPSISYATTGNNSITLAVTNGCGTTTATSNTFVVQSSATIQNEVTTVCSGTAFSVVPSTTTVGNTIPSGTTYSWNTPIVTGGITGGITGGLAGIDQISIGGTLVNPTSSPQTATYTVTPKSGTCSGAPFSVVVTVNPSPILTTQPTSSTVCQGGIPTVLSVVLNNTSGSPSYQWYSNTTSPSATGTAISGETNTTYNPTSTTIGTTYYYCMISLASGGCSSIKSDVASVTITPSGTISQPLATQNLCIGSTISTPLTVTSSGGTGTPNYQWYFNNNTNTNSGGTLISGATASSYTPPVFTTAGSFYYYVEVNNCGTVTSNVAEIVIFNDPTISSQPLASQTLCQTAPPTNLVVVPNGTGAFTYQWYSNSSNNTTSGTLISGATNTTYTPPTTLAGTKYYYCVVSQNGISGCGVTSATAEVIVTLAPIFTTHPASSTICLGQTPTPLSVAYSNGSGTANYQWYSNTSNSTLGATSIGLANSSSYTPPATTVGAVYYYCEITFPSLSGGCSVITSNIALVTINPKPSIASQTITICSGATLTAPISYPTDIIPSGTTYTWSVLTISPAGAITGASSEATPQNQISQALTNITTSPATVTYSVTPKTGSCVGSTFTITVTVNPATNPNVIKTDITCFGVNNGSITTNITGGIPPYTITWTYPNGTNSAATSITNLVPGVYNLSITDAGGCPISNNYSIAEPAAILITVDSENDITCNGLNNGSITISVTGGTGAYTYTWTKNGLPYATTDDIINLVPATYVVSVSDANNCGPKTMTFTITEPPVLTVSLVSQTNVDCYGFATGSMTVNVAGGTPNPSTLDYSYSGIGPNGTIVGTQTFPNLLAGTYNLTVTDYLGCTSNLNVTITQSTEILINATTTPILCDGDNNGTIAVTLSGGNPPYVYQWDNLAVGLNQNNLAPGNYKITVTDAKFCVKSLTINIPSPPIFRVNPVVTDISCFGAHDGSIVLNFVGGIAPVNLVWSDGSTSGITRNNLGPGTYSVIITDSKPCTISKTFVILEPQPLVLSANTTNALDCNNANTGAINLLVSGGTPPFIYLWNNGITTEDLINIPAGNYALTVTDARGCTKTAQYSITRPNPLTLSVTTTTNANCNTHTITQNFTALASDGVPPYSYTWSSGTTSGFNNEFMTTTQNGLVTVTATDAVGCTTTYSLNVVLQSLGDPTFTTSSIGYTSYGIYSILDPIQFNSTITGDYISVLWDFGDGTFSNEINPIHTYLIPKDFYLVTQTVTYPFGCVYVKPLKLNIEKGYLLVVPTAFTPNNNDGINDTLRPVTKGLKNVHLDVYDTWGSLIYSEVNDTIVGWDGKVKGISSENGNYYVKVSGETFYGTIVNENHTFVLIK